MNIANCTCRVVGMYEGVIPRQPCPVHSPPASAPAATAEPDDDGSESGEEFDAAYWPAATPEPDCPTCAGHTFPSHISRDGTPICGKHGAIPPAGPSGEEAETLHAAASDLRHIANGGSCEPSTLLAHADALLAQATELAALREALKFYATPANWMTPSTGFALQYDPEPSPISKDSGQRARAALAPRQTTEGHEHG